MNERITTDQLSPGIRRLRRCQVIFAMTGMGAFVLSLIGGAVESRWLAWIGIGGFAVCLVTLLAVGAITWLYPSR